MCDLLCVFTPNSCDSRCLIPTIITQKTKLGLPDRRDVRPLTVTVVSFFTPPRHRVPITLSGLWLTVWSVLLRLVLLPFSAHANDMLSEGADLSSFSFSVLLIPPKAMIFLCKAAGVKCILYIAKSSFCLSVTCDSIGCVPVRRGGVCSDGEGLASVTFEGYSQKLHYKWQELKGQWAKIWARFFFHPHLKLLIVQIPLEITGFCLQR